jgi:hypothetical protein
MSTADKMSENRPFVNSFRRRSPVGAGEKAS